MMRKAGVLKASAGKTDATGRFIRELSYQLEMEREPRSGRGLRSVPEEGSCDCVATGPRSAINPRERGKWWLAPRSGRSKFDQPHNITSQRPRSGIAYLAMGRSASSTETAAPYQFSRSPSKPRGDPKGSEVFTVGAGSPPSQQQCWWPVLQRLSGTPRV